MSTTQPSRKQTKKRSTVRHTRAIQRDRTKRPNSAPLDEQVSQHLTQILHPATLAQVAHFHQLGLRERLLTLPVMVALVLTLLWRQVPSVGELVRLLRCEGFLCSRLPRHVWFEEDPQAHDQRFWPRIQAALTPGTLLLFDPVVYLVQNAKWLGILKRTRKRDGPQLPTLPCLTNPAGA